MLLTKERRTHDAESATTRRALAQTCFHTARAFRAASHHEEIEMSGTVHNPVKPEPAEDAANKPASALAHQAQTFFARFGANVCVASTPRPIRPGSTTRRHPPPSQTTADTYRSSSAASVDDTPASARERDMAAEADIIDDAFADSDAPGC